MNFNTRIGIVGGGIEGLAAAGYFALHGFKNVVLFDQKEKLEVKLPKGVGFYGGVDYLEKALECEMILRSPGVSLRKIQEADGLFKTKTDQKSVPGHTHPSQNSQMANGKSIPGAPYPIFTSTTEYFLEHCPCPVIGVTGTKGKGTTATLIYLMLKEAGHDVYLGGNIGHSPFEFLDKLTPNSLVALEMSSFQLQNIRHSPHIAVMLGVTSDHLDYHQNVEEYREAKSGIVRFQKADDFVIFNKDYKILDRYIALTKATKIEVSTRHKVTDGVFAEDEKIVVIDGGQKEIVAEVSEIALLGRHNLENVLPAVAVANLLKVPISAIQKVVYSFRGLPHRLEFVAEIKGVSYYDDSISTTPETSIAATYAFRKSVILLAGGSEKGADYAEWGQQLQKNSALKMVVLMGAMAGRMEKALKNAAQRVEFPLKIYHAKDLPEAVKIASTNAVKGDVVLLSPAAASLDMFKNYKERAYKFRELVEALKT